MPIHIMSQPDFLTARVLALEDVEVYVEDLEFARVLCEETMAVKRESPMQVSNWGPLSMSLPSSWHVLHNPCQNFLQLSPGFVCPLDMPAYMIFFLDLGAIPDNTGHTRHQFMLNKPAFQRPHSCCWTNCRPPDNHGHATTFFDIDRQSRARLEHAYIACMHAAQETNVLRIA